MSVVEPTIANKYQPAASLSENSLQLLYLRTSNGTKIASRIYHQRRPVQDLHPISFNEVRSVMNEELYKMPRVLVALGSTDVDAANETAENGVRATSEAPSVGEVEAPLRRPTIEQQQLAQAAAAMSGDTMAGAVEDLSTDEPGYTTNISVVGSKGEVPISNQQEWEEVVQDIRANRVRMEGLLKVIVDVST